MTAELPTALTVGGRAYAIRTDYRVLLHIFSAFNDPDLNEQEKCYVCLKCLYKDFESIPKEHLQEAAEKAYRFAGGGDTPGADGADNVKLFDWEQDESMIFPAVNKAAGFEVRSVDYMHWWTFLGLFGVVDEGLLTRVIHIRRKRAKGKKLDKTEQEFYREHRQMIDLRARLTVEQLRQQAEDDAFLKELLGE